ncbi:MAG: HEAT repeat domain-containing protein [Planctomycetaceae bacterium]|nr:HEAT repeat domain-containing protein [Planctomycetaceae bacterium]
MNDGLIPLPRLVIFYVKYIDNNDTAAFISNVSRFYTVGTLERLTSSDRVEVRRSAALALGFLGDQESDASLMRLLRDEDHTVRLIAENGMRSIWTRAGSDANRQMMRVVLRLILAKQYDEAITKATELIERAPKFAEAWNQRAIAHFALKQYHFSVEDGVRALKLNRHHFAAAIGVGHAHLFLGNISHAIDFFQLALDINPNLNSVRENLSKLVQSLQEE